jgi:hypothetical protein
VCAFVTILQLRPCAMLATCICMHKKRVWGLASPLHARKGAATAPAAAACWLQPTLARSCNALRCNACKGCLLFACMLSMRVASGQPKWNSSTALLTRLWLVDLSSAPLLLELAFLFLRCSTLRFARADAASGHLSGSSSGGSFTRAGASVAASAARSSFAAMSRSSSPESCGSPESASRPPSVISSDSSVSSSSDVPPGPRRSSRTRTASFSSPQKKHVAAPAAAAAPSPQDQQLVQPKSVGKGNKPPPKNNVEEDVNKRMYHSVGANGKPLECRCELIMTKHFRYSISKWTCRRCFVERSGAEAQEEHTYFQCACEEQQRVCWSCVEAFNASHIWRDNIARLDGAEKEPEDSKEWPGAKQPQFAECLAAEEALKSTVGRRAASKQEWIWSFSSWVRYSVDGEIVLEPRVHWAVARSNGSNGPFVFTCMLEEHFKSMHQSLPPLVNASCNDPHGNVSLTCSHCGPEVMAVSHCKCMKPDECHEALCGTCIKKRRGSALETGGGEYRFKLLPLLDSHTADATSCRLQDEDSDLSYIPECTFLLNVFIGKTEDSKDVELYSGNGAAISTRWNKTIFSTHALIVGYKLLVMQLRIDPGWISPPHGSKKALEFIDEMKSLARALQECGANLQRGIVRFFVHTTQHQELNCGKGVLTHTALLRQFVAPIAQVWNAMRHCQRHAHPKNPTKPRLLLMLQACDAEPKACETSMRDALRSVASIDTNDPTNSDGDDLVKAALPDSPAVTPAMRAMEDADASFDMLIYKNPINTVASSDLMRRTLLHYSNRLLSKDGPYKHDYPLVDILRMAHAADAEFSKPVLLTWNIDQSGVPNTNTVMKQQDIWQPDKLPICMPKPSSHPSRQLAAGAASSNGDATSVSAAAAAPHGQFTSSSATATGSPPFTAATAANGVFVPPPLNEVTSKQRQGLIFAWLNDLRGDESYRGKLGWGKDSEPVDRSSILALINSEAPKSDMVKQQLQSWGCAWKGIANTNWGKDSVAAKFLNEFFSKCSSQAGSTPGRYRWTQTAAAASSSQSSVCAMPASHALQATASVPLAHLPLGSSSRLQLSASSQSLPIAAAHGAAAAPPLFLDPQAMAMLSSMLAMPNAATSAPATQPLAASAHSWMNHFPVAALPSNAAAAMPGTQHPAVASQSKPPISASSGAANGGNKKNGAKRKRSPTP